MEETKPKRRRPGVQKGHSHEYVYRSLIGRCYDKKEKGYKSYGAKGIKVCDRWLNSFAAFVEDMGPRPEGTTLDRIDNSKGYEPSNCRWATWTEQANNRSNNVSDETRQKVIELRREGYSYDVIARMTMISRGSAHLIIKKLGHDPFTTPKAPPSWLDTKRIHRVRAILGVDKAKQQKIITWRTAGISFREIGKLAGLSENTIRQVIRSYGRDPMVKPIKKPKGKVKRLSLQKKRSIIGFRTKGLSHRWIARKVGVSPATVARIIRGLGSDPIVSPVYKGLFKQSPHYVHHDDGPENAEQRPEDG